MSGPSTREKTTQLEAQQSTTISVPMIPSTLYSVLVTAYFQGNFSFSVNTLNAAVQYFWDKSAVLQAGTGGGRNHVTIFAVLGMFFCFCLLFCLGRRGQNVFATR